jgi:hypothetical protein
MEGGSQGLGKRGGGGASTCPGTRFGSKCVAGSRWNGGVRAMLRRHGRCSTAGQVGMMAGSVQGMVEVMQGGVLRCSDVVPRTRA